MKEQTHVIEEEFLVHQTAVWTLGIIRQKLLKCRRSIVHKLRSWWQDLAATAIIIAILLAVFYTFLSQLALSGW